MLSFNELLELDILMTSDYIDNYDMFIIDEAQFYPDLVNVCKFLINESR